MTRCLPVLVLGSLMVLGVPAAAQELAGRYTVSGVSPDGSTQYTGTAAVAQDGDTYSVAWQLEDGQQLYLGTGILRGSSFAVVYQSPVVPTAPGLVLYDIDSEGSMTGYYSVLGARAVGAETWTPVKQQ